MVVRVEVKKNFLPGRSFSESIWESILIILLNLVTIIHLKTTGLYEEL